MGLANDKWQVINDVEATKTLEELTVVFNKFIEQFGFTSIAISQISNPLLIKDPSNQVFITTWSPEWQEHWWKSGYYQHDPIIHYLLKSRSIFTWDVVYQQASKIGKKIIDESRAFGFKNGITLPITTGVGPLGIVSLGIDEVILDQEILTTVQTVSTHTYMHIVKLKNLALPYLIGSLSKRETEIMHLVSQGKTNWEIAHILELSDETIKSNLKRVSQKLNTVNRAHSVSEAIRKGLILG